MGSVWASGVSVLVLFFYPVDRCFQHRKEQKVNLLYISNWKSSSVFKFAVYDCVWSTTTLYNSGKLSCPHRFILHLQYTDSTNSRIAPFKVTCGLACICLTSGVCNQVKKKALFSKRWARFNVFVEQPFVFCWTPLRQQPRCVNAVVTAKWIKTLW